MTLEKTLRCDKCGKKFVPRVDFVVGFCIIKCIDNKEWLFDFDSNMWLCPVCSKIMRECFLGYEVEE